MTRTRRPGTRSALALGSVLMLGALSACGSQLNPGVAVSVGDQSYSMSEVDSLSGDLCDAVRSNPQIIGEGVPMATVKASIARAMVYIAVADQLGREEGVSASADYRSVQQQAQLQLGSVDPDVRARVVPYLISQNYFLDVATQVGAKKVGDDVGSADQAQAEGLKEAVAYAKGLDITLDPQLPQVELAADQILTSSAETSVAVSDFAKGAAADQPDPGWLGDLPADQKCMPKG